MKQRLLHFIALAMIILFISSFKAAKRKVQISIQMNQEITNISETLMNEVMIQKSIKIPFTGKTFEGFKQNLAFKESQGKYHSVSIYGYLGIYQFGSSTLKTLGIKDAFKFLKNSELQEKALIANIARNKWLLKKEIAEFSGKSINNIMVTESGILAAAHLGGPGAIKKYLKTKGNYNKKDGMGTTIKMYLKNFSGYDLDFIHPLENAKATSYN